MLLQVTGSWITTYGKALKQTTPFPSLPQWGVNWFLFLSVTAFSPSEFCFRVQILSLYSHLHSSFVCSINNSLESLYYLSEVFFIINFTQMTYTFSTAKIFWFWFMSIDLVVSLSSEVFLNLSVVCGWEREWFTTGMRPIQLIFGFWEFDWLTEHVYSKCIQPNCD